MNSAGSRFELSNANSIVSLSLDISSYPETGPLLSDLRYTLTRAPNLTRFFLSISPTFYQPAEQHQSPLWETLDSHLSQLDGLKNVIVISPYTPEDLDGWSSEWHWDTQVDREDDLMSC